ncbi:head completion adaptor [Vibrio phage V-YDF132]|nr:head completion adaptor [Vibrio phage V-YDF132]
MLLCSVSRLRTRLNVKDTPKFNTALSDLLLSVTASFESHLNTSFRRATYEDTFFLDPSNFLTNDPNRVRLYLRGMFPSAVKPLLKEVRTHAGTEISATNFEVDVKNGYVNVMDVWMKGDFIGVQYDAGFESVEEDGYLVYQDVPEELVTAALIYAEYIFVRKYGDMEQESGEDAGDYTTPPFSVQVILGRYDRVAPHTVKPL